MLFCAVLVTRKSGKIYGHLALPELADQIDQSANETHEWCQTHCYFQVADLTPKKE